MLGYYDVMKIGNRKLRHYMIQYLEIMMTISSVLAIKSGTSENLEKKKGIMAVSEKAELSFVSEASYRILRPGLQSAG